MKSTTNIIYGFSLLFGLCRNRCIRTVGATGGTSAEAQIQTWSLYIWRPVRDAVRTDVHARPHMFREMLIAFEDSATLPIDPAHLESAGVGGGMIQLPEYARVVRTLSSGEHPFVALLPLVKKSPAVRRIESRTVNLDGLLESARVRIEPGKGYVWIDDKLPAIVLIERYYREGSPLDLYLDLIHELTHLRQLAERRDVWDERFPYVDRPTEIEGYAVAIEEGLRLGMTEEDIKSHLSNPWMTGDDVRRLRYNIERFLSQSRRPQPGAQP